MLVYKRSDCEEVQISVCLAMSGFVRASLCYFMVAITCKKFQSQTTAVQLPQSYHEKQYLSAPTSQWQLKWRKKQ